MISRRRFRPKRPSSRRRFRGAASDDGIVFAEPRFITDDPEIVIHGYVWLSPEDAAYVLPSPHPLLPAAFIRSAA